MPPSPPIDNIWTMVFEDEEGRLSELFCVVLCTEAVHSHKAHLDEQFLSGPHNCNKTKIKELYKSCRTLAAD